MAELSLIDIFRTKLQVEVTNVNFCGIHWKYSRVVLIYFVELLIHPLEL